MATTKITDLTAYTDPVNTDVLPIVDVTSDVTKKVSIANVMKNASLGSAAAPGISFDGDPNTGIYSPGANQVAISTDGTARLTAGTTAITAAIPVDVLLGSASTPSYTFTGDLNTGIYSPGADQVAISTNGTGRLFVDSSGNVGITESSPSSYSAGAGIPNLVLKGSSATFPDRSGAVTFLSQDTTTAKTAIYHDTDFYIQNTTATNIRFLTNNTECLRITSDGKVGLGTSSPGSVLDLGVGTAGRALSWHNTSTVSYGHIWNAQGSGAVVLAHALKGSTSVTDGFESSIGTSRARSALELKNGIINLYTDAASTVAYGTAFTPTPRLTIDSSGRVGVGTTSPAAPFHIGSTATNTYALFDDGTNARITFYGSTSTAGIYSTTTGFGAYEDLEIRSAATIFKRDGTNESARFDSSGRLGIGTSSPSANLESQGNVSSTTQFSGFQGLRIQNANGSAHGITADINFVVGTSSDNRGAVIGAEYTSAASGNDLYFATNPNAVTTNDTPVERMRITSAGRVGIGTTSPSQLLHVSGTAAAGDVAIRIQNAAATDSAGSATLEFVQGAGHPAGKIVSVRQGNYSATAANQDSALAFHTALDGVDSERARIDSSGRLLVGTSTARANFYNSANATRLQTEGTNFEGSSGAFIRNSNDDSAAGLILAKSRGTSVGSNTVVQSGDYCGEITFQGNDGSEFVSAVSIAGVIDGTPGANDMPGRIVFSTTADGAASPTERMRIDRLGRLLVGTSTARAIEPFSNTTAGTSNQSFLGEQTHVDGKVGIACVSNSDTTADHGSYIYLARTRGSAVGSNTIVQSGDNLGTIGFAGADGTDIRTKAAAIYAEVDGTPGANDMPGRLVFSTTADGASSPTERMRITSGGVISLGPVATASLASKASTTRVFAATESATNTGSVAIESYADSTATRHHITFSNGNGAVGSISTNASATAYNTSSDYRLKENVVAVTDGITRLQQLKPSRFNFIADPTKTVDGFIAHEVQSVVPEAITGEKDAVDENGDPQYQGIDQSKLVPLLTAALQEAIAEINVLKDRVTALEGA